ncbi:hypothetical protein MKEN_01279300 [Mycena kentingensis (nom. inval.)]|nr:hypothetical protein MKEN_01279300 [Mycena kentingensis (nom. inval.)]
MLLLTSTRYDKFLTNLRFNNLNGEPSPYLFLSLHYDRLRDAAAAHSWPDALAALTFDALLDVCDAAVASYDGDADALRVRVTLSQEGQLLATAFPTPALRRDPTAASFTRPLTDSATLYGPPMTIYIDTEPSPDNGLFTTTKTTERAIYNAARARVGLPPGAGGDYEVLLYNSEEHITESSIFNVAFFRSGQWVTPPVEEGCLPGVVRGWLLRNKRIREAKVGEITKSQMNPGDWVLLFNSVAGCVLARIASTPPPAPTTPPPPT